MQVQRRLPQDPAWVKLKQQESELTRQKQQEPQERGMQQAGQQVEFPFFQAVSGLELAVYSLVSVFFLPSDAAGQEVGKVCLGWMRA